MDEDDDADGEQRRERINVLDAFGGVGGNLIQFAKRGFCVGVDNDPIKVNYMKNNAKIYGLEEYQDFQVLERDFLRLESYRQINLMEDEEDAHMQCVHFPSTNSNK